MGCLWDRAALDSWRRMPKLLLLTLLAILASSSCAESGYLAGIGVGDITGPVADVNLMGYARPEQTAQGLHTRLHARAFAFADAAEPRRRFVYVSMDACMASQLVTMRVRQRLAAEYGDLYDRGNVAISGTHTHASPAGFLQYVLYGITSLGFVQETFDAMVDGIVEAVRGAHASLRPSRVLLGAGHLLGGSINRSPTAYDANPQEERSRYAHNVDTDLTLLRLEDAEDGAGRGLLSWFAVHCTSLNNTNRLVSGDNKAAAQIALEAWAAATAAGGADAALAAAYGAVGFDPGAEVLRLKPGEAGYGIGGGAGGAEGEAAAAAQLRFAKGFVAAVAQAAVGDTSPNTLGAFCLETGLPCDVATSTCNGRNEQCHGRGPAWPDDAASAAVIGLRQFAAAQAIYQNATAVLSGPVDFRHVFLDMSNVTVQPSAWTRAGRTCPPAMGMSFAAGTTDGPGAFDFTQGDTHGPPLWRLLGGLLFPTSPQQRACQAPKPILINTGEATFPYPWQPRVTEVSLLRLGPLLVACLPGEPSTMAGRRIKAALRQRFAAAVPPVRHVVISGLTGTYSSYITTFEEYQVQRYEGASTLYGPHTLDAYIQELLRLADSMLAGTPVTSAVQPPDLQPQQVSLLPPVVVDAVPPAARFGDVTRQPAQAYRPGDTASATFRAACPRNNLRRNGTFMAVEVKEGDTWRVVYDDRDWITRFHWSRPSALSPESFATLSWTIPPTVASGTYRFRYFGDSRSLFGSIRPFQGISNDFQVLDG